MYGMVGNVRYGMVHIVWYRNDTIPYLMYRIIRYETLCTIPYHTYHMTTVHSIK